MLKFPTVWVPNSPDSLLNTAIRFCIKYPRAFCQYNPREDGYELREGLSLPEEICERMLAVCKAELEEVEFGSLIKIFKDTARTRLRHVDLSDSSITDNVVEILSWHKINELNISGCKELTSCSLNSIGKLWNDLLSLNIGSSSHIFFKKEEKPARTEEEERCVRQYLSLLYAVEPEPQKKVEPHNVEPQSPTCLPMLKKLTIHNVARADQNPGFLFLLNNARSLIYLDLSKCELADITMFHVLSTRRLTSLILCDYANVHELIPLISRVTTLRHLDLSRTSDNPIIYRDPNSLLKIIAAGLPCLVSLDISGTNLAGGRAQEGHTKENGFYDQGVTDIPGLACRAKRPLEFLGLLNCAFDACYRHHIPAKRIAGDASEEQILIAGQAYCSREPMIQKVLNDLFQIFRFSTCHNTRLALDVLMEAMRLHLKVKHIQVSGSASLFYIVKGEHKDLFNIKMRRKIIKLLIDAMSLHSSDVTMLRNGCLTLIHFKIPDDVFFAYKRLAVLLLRIVGQDDQDEFVQRIGVYLLNSLACQVDGMEKKLVGDHGAISTMLQVIGKRLQRSICDEVMETAWSTMWNVTDETPVNCARFLQEKGMDLFLGCLRAFPQKPELLRNMMGLLGNVAEVKELRCHLMKDEYLIVFSQLLNSKSDGIEVSYNAAGILSHIASDGVEPWIMNSITVVEREEVLKQMVEAIEKWNLDTKRNINYRSFKPILRLLVVEHTPEAQYWAVWALANLTTVYPEKYCTLLKDEGGIELLQYVMHHPSYQRIYELAEITINNCMRYKEGASENNIEEDDVHRIYV